MYLNKVVKRRGIIIPLIIITFIVFLTLLINPSPHEIYEVNPAQRLLPPSLSHPFGTDALGRDVLMRLIVGTRISLMLSISAVLLAAIIGTISGIIAAIHGSIIKLILSAIFEYLYIIPSIIIAFLLSIITSPGPHVIIIASTLFLLPLFFRISLTAASMILTQPYIEAAYAIGASSFHIALNHILRIYLPILLVLIIYNIPQVIFYEIILSFIGLGIQPPTPSLGIMIIEGVKYIQVAPHILEATILFLFILVFSLNVLSEELEKSLEIYSLSYL